MRMVGGSFAIEAIDRRVSRPVPVTVIAPSPVIRQRVSLTPADAVACSCALSAGLGCAATPEPSGQRSTKVEPTGARRSSAPSCALAKSITSGGIRV